MKTPLLLVTLVLLVAGCQSPPRSIFQPVPVTTTNAAGQSVTSTNFVPTPEVLEAVRVGAALAPAPWGTLGASAAMLILGVAAGVLSARKKT